MLVILFSITGCRKESTTIKGCTNANAENYNSSATADDGSCQFKGSLIVWTKPPCTNVNLSMDGTYQGELTSTSNTAPTNCSSTGAFKIYMQWGGSQTKSFHFKGVVNNNTPCTSFIGTTWEKDVILEGKKCQLLELK